MAIRYIVQHRYGTTAEWQQAVAEAQAKGEELIPLKGEFTVELDSNLKHRLKIGDGVTPYQQLKYISVDDFIFEETAPKIIKISLLADDWQKDPDGSIRYYQEVLGLQNVTANTQLTLQPSPEQLEIFHDKNLAFTTKTTTVNGVTSIKVCSIGDIPDDDYEIQATMKEVVING